MLTLNSLYKRANLKQTPNLNYNQNTRKRRKLTQLRFYMMRKRLTKTEL